MAISITSNGSRVKLVIAGCIGECSAGHNHFEEYEWDRSKHGEVNVYWFEGSFSDYEENKKKRLGDVQPHRFRYKKLVAG